MNRHYLIYLFSLWTFLPFAADQVTHAKDFASNEVDYLSEEFTAHSLEESELLIGTDLTYGLGKGLQVGTDTTALLAGIPAFEAKWHFWNRGSDQISVGLRLARASLEQLAGWTEAKETFSHIDGIVFRPALSWTNLVSNRLRLHTHWTMGIGRVEASLSEEGKRQVAKQKYPDRQVDGTNAPKNNSKKASLIGRRLLELQSLFGLTTDRFQITGELIRDNGNRVLVTSRVEQMKVADLEASSIRLTLSQHWVLDSFQFRLGVGALYLAIQGTDLDEEVVDQWGVTPVSDLVFYWIL